MDRENEQFETLLRQFQLRRPRPLPQTVVELSKAKRRNLRWILVAAAVLAVFVLSIVLIRGRGDGRDTVASIESSGERIFSGDLVSSGSGTLVLILTDESRVEMPAQTEIRIESAPDGLRVLLNSGKMTVVAKGRKNTRLVVETRDTRASVSSAIFVVETRAAGTRVAAIEGSVEVQQGATAKVLMPGEQISTEPSSMPPPPPEAITRPQTEEKALTEMIESLRRGTQNQTPNEPPPIPQPATTPDPQQEANASKLPGRAVFERECSTCHNLQVSSVRYGTKNEYTALIQRKQGMGAGVAASEVPTLSDYMFEAFGLKGK